MIPEAPRAFNREMYHNHPENVFYGTDDGYQDGSFGEFPQIRAHYEAVAPERRENIHMISVVGVCTASILSHSRQAADVLT